MSTTHKAILNPDGTFRGLVPTETATDASRTRIYVPADPPQTTDSEVAEFAYEITDTHVTQVWTTRTKTDAEAQTTLEQLTVIERLSDAELIALEDICQPGHRHAPPAFAFARQCWRRSRRTAGRRGLRHSSAPPSSLASSLTSTEPANS